MLGVGKQVLVAALVCAVSWTAMAATDDMTDRMNTLLGSAYPADGPGAAVIVVKDGRTVFRQAYGLANIELGHRAEPDMVYGIGSLTKQFTAVAILILVKEHRLSLEDNITRYLPDYPTHGQVITIANLLTHTSGIKNYVEPASWRRTIREDWPLTRLIEEFKSAPLDFPPGQGWHYSNSNYVLLGAIIEKVSGLTYADFLRTRIFVPLGMMHTYYGDTRDIIPRRVTGYAWQAGVAVSAPYMSLSQLYAAAGLLSSVDDLARWYAGLDAGTLVPADLLARAWTPALLKDGSSTGYGYGWALWSFAGHPVAGHNGNIFGFVSSAVRLPRDHLFVAVLANSSSPAVSTNDICMKLVGLALGVPIVEPRPVILPAQLLATYSGTYQAGASVTWNIQVEGDHLLVERNEEGWERAYPRKAGEFYIERSGDLLLFHSNSHGVPPSLDNVRFFSGTERAVRVAARK